MIVSLNWLKKFTEIDMPVDELATLIGARLVEIEEVIDIGAKYKGVLVAKVVEAKKLEGSDHLSVTKIDDGGKCEIVERDVDGLIQVVCGAPNIASGQLVAWLPPESIVPATLYSSEPFKLGKRELRGVISNGMIASAKELDLFDEHEGILTLDESLEPGTPFAEAYELDDYLLDIENKSLTHRPDCFGIIGFAREVAAITGKPFKTPDWLLDLDAGFGDVEGGAVDLTVSIDDPELSSRYQAIVMTNADGNKKSPLQIQTYLARVGVRPINAVVDVTNYLMMLTGQPLHAFDYDKLVSAGGGKADIHVRAGREKEKLELLDGRSIELTTDDVVISAGDTVIGLAGAMGGANTAIDDNTTKIIIEAASFNLYNLRATQMRHGIFSEAITRFTKGQPANLTAPVLSDAIRLVSEWAGARVISKIADTYPERQKTVSIETNAQQLNQILGTAFSSDDIASILGNVEFAVEKQQADQLVVTVPYWRADIHIVEDISEEVGRLVGFDCIQSTLPMREFVAIRPSDFDDFRGQLRKLLARAGADEVLTYSFVHGDVIQKSGQSIDNSYAVSNSISPNLQYYRQTLTPSLLDLVHPNIKQGFNSFALFEMNKTHAKSDGLTDEGVPVEGDRLALAVANKNVQPGAAYYQAKRILVYICERLGIDVNYQENKNDSDHHVKRPFEFRRSASLIDANGKCIGVVGEYKKSVSKNFKLPVYAAGFDIDVSALFRAMTGMVYHPISRFPSAERDICFQVSEKVNYGRIIESVAKALSPIQLETSLDPVDIYRPESGAVKNVTLRIKLTAHDHTLSGDEVADVINSVSGLVSQEVGATVI